ncbi:hypothetical protein AB5N19_07302 [Seiridium cardinale]
MRIHVSILGLAACLSGVSRAGGDGGTNLQSRSSNTRIIFNTDWESPPIFTADKNISWTIPSDAPKVVRVNVKKNSDQNTVIATAVSSYSGMAPSTGKRADIVSRQPQVDGAGSGSPPINLVADLDHSSLGSVIISLSSQANAKAYQDAGATLTPLFLELFWTDDDSLNGSSYSSYFALDPYGQTNETLISELTTSDGAAYNPARDECEGNWACGTSSATSTSSQVPFGTSTATPSSSATTAATGSNAASSANQSGLSTGAIAGIAVACGVVGLALIGAAIWFCIRRRRTSRHAALTRNNGYNSDGVGMGIMADKEMPHVTDSPHSTYAADRGQLHGPREVSRGSMTGAGVGVGAGAGLINGAAHTPHGGEDSYPPYSDHTPTPRASRAIGEGAGAMDSQTSLPVGGARSPTPPISGRYAHLVEEGMTDDEIRRLEAEERALDMAIEDAGRSSRAQ